MVVVDLAYPCLDEDKRVAEHAHTAATRKALKQISFPEMDSDGLPSSYVTKVLACLAKWQVKMADLAGSLDPTQKSMKPNLNNNWCLMVLVLCMKWPIQPCHHKSPPLASKTSMFKMDLGVPF